MLRIPAFGQAHIVAPRDVLKELSHCRDGGNKGPADVKSCKQLLKYLQCLGLLLLSGTSCCVSFARLTFAKRSNYASC